MSWAHGVTYVSLHGGRAKALCKCGKQSSKLPDMSAAHAWYATHTGIKEVKRGR